MKYEYYHGKKKISANEYIEFLHEQLQSYKQKEDKLREIIEPLSKYENELVAQQLLQILNDGDKQ